MPGANEGYLQDCIEAIKKRQNELREKKESQAIPVNEEGKPLSLVEPNPCQS